MATIAKPTLTRSCFAFLLGVLGCGIYLFGWTTTVDAASYSETIQADNPLAWWRLGDDAGSNTVAEQIAGYSGTVGQDVTLGTAGAPSGGDAWQVVAASDSPTGWRLETTVDMNAADIKLPINVDGTYAVYIGVYMPDTGCSGVFVSDNEDPYYAYIRGLSDGAYPAYHETLYKVMDCTADTELVFRQPAEGRSYITHVRLEPRTEVPEMPVATREVIGLADTWHYYYFFSTRQEDGIDSLVNMHALCGMTDISLEAGRSCMTYNTEVGTVCGYDYERPRTKWLGYHAEHSQPFQRSVAAAKELGVNLSSRLCMNMHYVGDYRGSITSDFANEHPEYREKRRDGTTIASQLCFGYQEVRDERVALFREMVEMGAEAISLDCMIYSPMASWGTPYVEGFQSQYGVDPRTLSTSDGLWGDWLEYRASSFTQLLREIDTMLQDVGHPEVKVSMRVSRNGLSTDLNSGVNMEELVSEGLVDRIILGGDFYTSDNPDPGISDGVIDEYKQLLDGTSVKLIAGLRAHGWPVMEGDDHHTNGTWPTPMYYAPDPVALAERVDHYYDLGVDGVAFYESDEGCLYPEMRDFFIACRTPETIKEYLANAQSGASSNASSGYDLLFNRANDFQPTNVVDLLNDSSATFTSTADGKITINDDAEGLNGAMDFGTDGDFTVEGWFRRPSVNPETGGIVNKGDTNASFWVLSWNTGEVGFLLDYGSTSDLAKSSVTFNDNEWHYFTAVADRDDAIRLYVDGVLVAEDNDLIGGDISNDLPFEIGNMGSLSLDGSLDEIAVYGYAFSEETVQAHFLAAMVSELIAGDANGDGRVDGSDVTILAANWQVGVNDGQTATWSMGDFNGDGCVDGSDVTILAGNWQYGIDDAAARVPEPSMLLLIGSLVTLFFGIRTFRLR